jgi:hypothetical protein
MRISREAQRKVAERSQAKKVEQERKRELEELKRVREQRIQIDDVMPENENQQIVNISEMLNNGGANPTDSIMHFDGMDDMYQYQDPNNFGDQIYD